MNTQLDRPEYEVPDHSRESAPHIYDQRLENHHSYLELTHSHNSETSNSGYVEPDGLYDHPVEVGKIRNRHRTQCCKFVLVFITGVLVGTTITVAAGWSAMGFSRDKQEAPLDSFESPSGNKSFRTFGSYEFQMLRCEIGNIPFQKKYISFSVKACSDVYVVLTSEYDDLGPLIEIALGLNGNTRSAIRKEKGVETLYVHKGNQLECQTYRWFWISWYHPMIRVGEGIYNERAQFVDGQIPFLYAKDQRYLDILNLGISTGYGTSGDWQFIKM